jgi:isopentenyl-diphosphate delta-isomerase
VITRIHYKAASDEKWGEHEIDYVLFIQKDVNVEMNPNEVKSFCFVDQTEMKDILQDAKDKKIIITPWFDLLCKAFLFKWWDNLNDLEKIKDVKTIHKMIKDL